MPEKILVRYQCRQREKAKEIIVAGRQQKIILIDKCLMTAENYTNLKEYYNLVLLEYGQ